MNGMCVCGCVGRVEQLGEQIQQLEAEKEALRGDVAAKEQVGSVGSVRFVGRAGWLVAWTTLAWSSLGRACACGHGMT